MSKLLRKTLLNGALAVAAMLALSAASLGGGSPEAKAATSCRHAHALGRTITRGAYAAAVRCLINEQRRVYDLRPLERSDILTGTARAHSRRMAKRNCFDHQCPGEPSLRRRMLKYRNHRRNPKVYWGENISWGTRTRGTPAYRVNAWMHSPGHRANILNVHYRETGVGIAFGAPKTGIPRRARPVILTQDFGAR